MNTSRQKIQPRQSANLVYFENWVDSIALTILAEERQLQVQRLRYDDPADINRMSMRSAHGYQIAPRGELRTPWFADRELLDECPQLLAISSTGAGYDMIDVQACTRAGVIVCNQSGSNSIAVAEHAVGLMLGIVHRLNNADRALRSGRKADRFALAGSDLSGKVVGLVGLGHIGTRVAALCKAFGMRVLAYDPYLRDEEISARRRVAGIP